MKDAVWFLLITAIGIPIGGLISSHIDRITARHSALLSAAQKRSDTEIAQLQDALRDLLAAATAVQSYSWVVDEDGQRATMSRETFEKYRSFIEPAVVGAQRLRTLSRVLPPGDLADSYTAVEYLIMKVVQGSDDPNAPDLWNEDVSGPQPDTVTRAVNATTDEIRRLHASYPTDLPPLFGREPGWGFDAAIVGTLAALSCAALLAGLLW